MKHLLIDLSELADNEVYVVAGNQLEILHRGQVDSAPEVESVVSILEHRVLGLEHLQTQALRVIEQVRISDQICIYIHIHTCNKKNKKQKLLTTTKVPVREPVSLSLMR